MNKFPHFTQNHFDVKSIPLHMVVFIVIQIDNNIAHQVETLRLDH